MNKLLPIIENKKKEIAERKESAPLSFLKSKLYYNRKPIPLYSSLSLASRADRMSVIAEIKRASPSTGTLKADADVKLIARGYEQAGAAAVSVLTDERFFGGTLHDLAEARSVTGLPLLRKDFILDEYQVHESKAYGADALLLIADILHSTTLNRLLDAAEALELEVLVEAYDKYALKKIDFDRVKMLGINNRDLRTFEVDIRHTEEMMQYIPGGVFVISESGIRNRADLLQVKEFGARGALVGVSLMESGSPEEGLRELLQTA